MREINKSMMKFSHSSLCQSADCTDGNCCDVMKKIVHHYYNGHSEYQEKCLSCKQIYGLSQIHAQTCFTLDCSVPFCATAKNSNDTRSLRDAAVGCAQVSFSLFKMNNSMFKLLFSLKIKQSWVNFFFFNYN